MLTLRIKGKYIVLAVGLFMILAGILLTTAVRAGTMHQLAQVNENWDAQEYLRQLAILYPNAEDAARELYFSAQADTDGLPERRHDLFIFPGGTLSTPWSPARDKRLAVAEEKYLLLREQYPQTVWADHALYQLVQLYYHLGHDRLLEEYALAAVRESGWQAAGSTQLLARLYLDRGDAQAALELAEESLRRQPRQLSLEMTHLQGRALLALGELERAAGLFAGMPGQALEVYTAQPGEEGDFILRNAGHWEDVSRRNLERINALQQAGAKTGSVSGRVLLGADGFSGARVYLLDRFGAERHFSTAELDDMRQSVSSADGYFRFDDVIPGRYVLGVAVRIADVQGYTLREQHEFVVAPGQEAKQNLAFTTVAAVREPLGGVSVTDHVEFRWEPVDGAVSYDLLVTPLRRKEKSRGSYGTALRSGITATHVSIDLSEEIKKARFYPSFGHTNNRLSPYSVFGQLYPGGEFAWSVAAFDANGKKISDSTGYGSIFSEPELPLFQISGTLTSADELVWAGAYEEAIAAYEEQLVSSPDDTHALLMLARIHHFGVTVGAEDYEKAAGYYERLIALEDTPEARNALAGVYAGAGRYREAHDVYLTLIGTPAENWGTHYELAKAEYQLGRPLEALTRLKTAVTMEYGQYARTYPVALSLVLGREAQALAFAGQVDEGEHYVDVLSQYVSEGYTVDESFRQAMLRGDYEKAGQLLDTSNQGRFLQALLQYLQSGRPAQANEALDGVHEQLLRRMFPYR